MVVFVKIYLNLKGLSSWGRNIPVGSVGVCLMMLCWEDHLIVVLVNVMWYLPFCLNNAWASELVNFKSLNRKECLLTAPSPLKFFFKCQKRRGNYSDFSVIDNLTLICKFKGKCVGHTNVEICKFVKMWGKEREEQKINFKQFFILKFQS